MRKRLKAIRQRAYYLRIHQLVALLSTGIRSIIVDQDVNSPSYAIPTLHYAYPQVTRITQRSIILTLVLITHRMDSASSLRRHHIYQTCNPSHLRFQASPKYGYGLSETTCQLNSPPNSPSTSKPNEYHLPKIRHTPQTPKNIANIIIRDNPGFIDRVPSSRVEDIRDYLNARVVDICYGEGEAAGYVVVEVLESCFLGVLAVELWVVEGLEGSC